MSSIELSRRALAIGTVGVATLASMQQAVAQSAAAGGTWMDMVKAHHMMIVQAFDEILATRDDQAGKRMSLQKKLAYLLTAHSVAEENTLYPALAAYGMVPGSDRLYIEQAHAKVMNAGLEMFPMNDPAWLGRVQTLKVALVQHATQEEEADLFPRLMQAASPAVNAKLTRNYQREFDRVART